MHHSEACGFNRRERKIVCHACGAASAASRHCGAGEMSDASETLLSLYDSINAIPGSQKPVNDIFGLDTVEYVECRSCNMKTHKNQFVEVRTFQLRPDCMLSLLASAIIQPAIGHKVLR